MIESSLSRGVVVSMAPIGSQHFAITLRMDRLLRAALGDRATVSVQGPVKMRPRSEPEPDIAVLKTSADDYETGLPEPTDVLLLVQVADTTLGRDRDVKGPLYARHGITEYWLVDVAAGQSLSTEIRTRRRGDINPSSGLEPADSWI
jgi:Uma2 family endonuclease